MKSKNSRPPVPHNGKKSRSSFTKKLVASSWDDQPDLSDEPELPEQDVNWDEVPDRSEDLNLSNTFSIEHAISFLLKYWTEPLKSDGKPELNDEERHLEINRVLSEQMLLDFFASEKIHESLKRVRSHQIDIELELGYDSSLHTICILVEFLENAKRNVEEILKDSILISKNCLSVSDKEAFRNYSALLHLLPQLYHVREFITLESNLSLAESVELSHFLHDGDCFKKNVGIAKVRKGIAQALGLVASELTLNTIAYNNKHIRTPLLLLKKLKRNWDIKHYGGRGACKID